MATYYIDYDSATDGVGSFADPKNTIPSYTTGDKLLFKEEVRYIRTTSWAPNVANLSIGSYHAADGTEITDGFNTGIIDFSTIAGANQGIVFGSAAAGLSIESLTVKNGEFVHHNGVTYICKSTHTSSAAGAAGDEPGVGANYDTYWHTCAYSIPTSDDWAPSTLYSADLYCVSQPNGVNGVTVNHLITIGGNSGLTIYGAGGSNYSVTNSEFYNSFNVASGAGCYIAGTSTDQTSNVVCTGNIALGNGVGIYIRYCSDLTFTGNSCTYNRSLGVWLWGISGGTNLIDQLTTNYNGHFGFGTGAGFCVDALCDTITIDRVVAHYNADNGITIQNGGTTAPNNIIFTRFSTMYNGDILYTPTTAVDGDGFSAHAGTDITFKNGISAYNLNSGTANVGGSTGTIQNCVIAWNGYYNGSPSPARYNRGGIANVNAGAWTLVNSIVYENRPWQMKLMTADSQTWTGYNNCYYRVAPNGYTVNISTDTSWTDWKANVAAAGGSEAASSFHLNPLFVSSTDFYLQALSPCINTGADLGTEISYNNLNQDLFGTGWEIGANVYYGAVGTSIIYIDPTAAPGGDGTIGSPYNAWADVTWAAGNIYSQKRGTICRVRRVTPDVSGTSGNLITLNSYGTTGDIPKIYGSVLADSAGDWTQVGSTNIWICNDALIDEDVGNIIFTETGEPYTCGHKVLTEAELTTQGYFWYDSANTQVKMYSVGNPHTVYGDAELALRGSLLALASMSYFLIEDLELRYSGNFAVSMESVTNITIQDCVQKYIGGSYHPTATTTRYGNGIQLWNNGSYINILRNQAYEVYDAAFTIQATGAAVSQHHINVRNNYAEHCHYSWEQFNTGAGSSTSEFYLENNTFIKAGTTWGQSQRSDPYPKIIRCSTQVAVSNCYIRNNIISGENYDVADTADHHSYLWYMAQPASGDWVIDYSQTYSELTGDRFYYRPRTGGWSQKTWAEWRTDTIYDVHSQWGDPLLLSTYILADTSPCRDTGLILSSLSDDIRGLTREQGSSYDIGCYELLAEIAEAPISASEGKCRFLYNNYITSESMLSVSSARTGIVSNALKIGTGSAVIATAGVYTGTIDREYVITIDAIGTGEIGSSTFKWSEDGGATWHATGVVTAHTPITLHNAVTVCWPDHGAGADFVIGDSWFFKCIQPFSAGKMVDLDRDHVYRSAALETPNKIDIDLGEPCSVMALVLYGHNLTSDAIITLNGNSINSFTVPLYTGLPSYNADKIAYYLTAATNLRHWEIGVTDIDNPDGYIEIEEIFLGTYTELSTNYSEGFGKSMDLIMDTIETPYGIDQDRFYNTQLSFDLDFNFIVAADITKLNALISAISNRSAGTLKPFWIHTNSAIVSDHWLVKILGLPIKHHALIYYDTSLEFKEVLTSR